MKEPLALLRQLFSEGVIDREFGIRPSDKVPQEISAGRVGIQFGAQWNSLWPLLETVQENPDVDWLPLMVPSSDNKPLRISARPGHAGWFVVNKDYAYPEALIKLINVYWDIYYLQSADFAYPPAPEGGTWEGWLLSPLYVHQPGFNSKTQGIIEKAYADNKFDHLDGEILDMFKFVDSYLKGNRADWGWARIFMPGEPGEVSQAGIDWYVKNGTFLEDKFLGVPSEEMTQKWPTLTALQEETFIKIIIGAYDLDHFDTFVDDWNRLGGAEITQSVNEWYKTQ